MNQLQAPSAKNDIKQLMIRLLEEELAEDLSQLKSRVDIDITCDTAVDSLSMVNIVVDLEAILGIEIEDAAIVPERMRSLDKFADFLVAKVAARAEAGVITTSAAAPHPGGFEG